jgi:catechol 2,3-dioxygenase-like lactoylglutathione lyase family enzyme
MLDHMGISVRDVARAKACYETALAPLGIGIVMEVSAAATGNHAYVGFGTAGKPFFWIGSGPTATTHLHVAFSAANRAAVDDFYRAGLSAGGADNGAPGLRPHSS